MANPWSPRPPDPAAPGKRDAALFRSFFKIGAAAFGGGYAILPLMEAELADRRGWFDVAEIAEAYALGQSVPGVIAINTAALLGERLGGRRGAAVAALAAALPAFLVILLVAVVLPEFHAVRGVRAALLGIRPAVIAIIVRAALRIGRFSLRSLPAALALLGTLLLMLWLRVNPVLPIVVAALAGVVTAWRAPARTHRILRREREKTA